MGGDQLVPALAGRQADEERGDAIRELRGQEFQQLVGEIEPLAGARELIADLKERDLTVVLASSPPQDELDHYLDLLDARELADGWTTDDDVEATKPEPDLVRAALEKGRLRRRGDGRRYAVGRRGRLQGRRRDGVPDHRRLLGARAARSRCSSRFGLGGAASRAPGRGAARNQKRGLAVVSLDVVSDLEEVDMYIGLGTLLVIVLIVLLLIYVF
jgi:hypothetical protein